MRLLRQIDWESSLKRLEALGAGLGLVIVVLTLTPGTATALGAWFWVALVVGVVLLVVNSVALLWKPSRALASWVWLRLPWDIHVTRKAAALRRADSTERGFLDYELGFLRGMTSVNDILGRITKEAERNARDTNTSTAKMKALVGAPVEKRIRGAKKSADSFTRYAERLERLESQYRTACQRMTTNFLDWVRTAPEANDWNSFDPTLASLAEVTRGSKASTTSYRDTIQESRNLKVSQDVNRSTDRLISATNKLIEDIDGIIKFCGEGRFALKRRIAGKQSPGVVPSTSRKAGFRR
jgi:hypothetical protein